MCDDMNASHVMTLNLVLLIHAEFQRKPGMITSCAYAPKYILHTMCAGEILCPWRVFLNI